MASKIATELIRRSAEMAAETNIGSGFGMPETIQNKQKNVARAIIAVAIEVVDQSKGMDRRTLLKYLKEAHVDS